MPTPSVAKTYLHNAVRNGGGHLAGRHNRLRSFLFKPFPKRGYMALIEARLESTSGPNWNSSSLPRSLCAVKWPDGWPLAVPSIFYS
jgi:hypothetical protein